jgi:hypothetical protein
VQVRAGELLVRVIPGAGYDKDVASRLQADIASKMRPATAVNVSSVEELERMDNGKFLLLISKCPSPMVVSDAS